MLFVTSTRQYEFVTIRFPRSDKLAGIRVGITLETVDGVSIYCRSYLQRKMSMEHYKGCVYVCVCVLQEWIADVRRSNIAGIAQVPRNQISRIRYRRSRGRFLLRKLTYYYLQYLH